MPSFLLLSPSHSLTKSYLHASLALALLMLTACSQGNQPSSTSGGGGSASSLASSTLAITPSTQTVTTNSQTAIFAVGGSSGYKFSVIGGGGSFNGSTYTAPASAQMVTIQVIDSKGNAAFGQITVIVGSSNTPSPSPSPSPSSPSPSPAPSPSPSPSPSPGPSGSAGPYATVVVGNINALSGVVSGCTGANLWSDNCTTAIHRSCASSGYASGFGVVEYSDPTAVYTCMQKSVASTINTTFSALSAYVSTCTQNNSNSDGCNSAAHRFCAANGYASGYGVVEHYQDNAAVVCVTSFGAVPVNTTFSALGGFQSTCQASNPHSAQCNTAAHRQCQNMGYVSGWGPVEHFNDNAAIVCVH